jgi:acetyl esterase/lipase
MNESHESVAIELWPNAHPAAAEANAPSLTYHPARAAGVRAAIVVCPGGGYTILADHEADPVADWLTENGIAAFVLRYRIAPHRHPAMIDDATRAMRTVRHRAPELGIDDRKVGILGFSAGGHLAGSASTIFDSGRPESADPVERLSSRPDLAILIYPVTHMDGPYAHAGSAVSLLGDRPDPEVARYLTLPNRVTQNTPPMFLVHSANDDGVPVENSLTMAAALHAHGVPYALHVFERGGHGYGLAQTDRYVGIWPSLCMGWLRERGFLS